MGVRQLEVASPTCDMPLSSLLLSSGSCQELVSCQPTVFSAALQHAWCVVLTPCRGEGRCGGLIRVLKLFLPQSCFSSGRGSWVSVILKWCFPQPWGTTGIYFPCFVWTWKRKSFFFQGIWHTAVKDCHLGALEFQAHCLACLWSLSQIHMCVFNG